MATKREGVSCYDKAGNDEPLFCLRAQDKTAPQTVRYWALMALQDGVPKQKCMEAMLCADAMEAWQIKHGKKLAD